MTTATPERVTITIPPDIVGNEDAMEQLRDGLKNAQATVHKQELEPFWSEKYSEYDPAVFDWERLCDEAVADIAPAVAQMLEDAIAERLPWTAEARGIPAATIAEHEAWWREHGG